MTHRDGPSETFTCPNCGTEVPDSAACCPEFGSDDETGWSQDTMYDDLDLPQDDEQEEEFDIESRIENGPVVGSLPGIVVAIIAALLIAAFLKWMW